MAETQLGDGLARLITRARTERPELELTDDALREHVRALHGDAGAERLDELCAGDLLLACACVRGDARALALLEAQFAPTVRDAVRAIDASRDFADEIAQQLRAHVLVGKDGQPARLAGYSGAGPLGAWLRVAALRLALASRRRERREVELDSALPGLAATHTPEQELARREHAELFRSALRDAIAAQPRRTRALLRYYYADRVGVEQLGKIYRVHASTISRQLAQARDAILAETRRRLATALARSEAEVDSLLGVSISLDTSLHTLLASQ